MRHRATISVLLVAIVALATPQGALATDGHFLHGVGAVNSAMGGAGTAAPLDLLGTFYLNPAGLMAFGGTRVDLGFEMFKPDRTVSSSLTVPFGPQNVTFEGSTQSTSSWTPIPAFAWTTRLSNDRVVLGLAGLGIGGFGVDYAASGVLPPGIPENPILAPRPNGFGQVFSNFQLMKIAPAVAYSTPDDKLWLGAAVNIDWAALTIDPMPAAAPAVSPGPDGTFGTMDDAAFYSRASATAGAFGFGFQIGAMYNVNDMLSLGAAYTSKQDFADFEFNSMWENPNIRFGPQAFGTPRTITFALDVPASINFGIGLQALPNLSLAADYRRILYADTDGFRLDNPDQPFNPDGSVAGFGWTDINVWAVGAEYKPTDRVALRFGYNHTDNPVPDALSMINVPAPAIVKDHLSVGLGLAFSRQGAINLAYYRAFGNSGTGPLYGPMGPIPGSSVTNELSEHSVLMSFSFVTRGSVF